MHDAHLRQFESIRTDFERLIAVIDLTIRRELERRKKLEVGYRNLAQAQSARKQMGEGEGVLERQLQLMCKWLSEPVIPENAANDGPYFLVGQAMKRYLKGARPQKMDRLSLLEILSKELHGDSGEVFIQALNPLIERSEC